MLGWFIMNKFVQYCNLHHNSWKMLNLKSTHWKLLACIYTGKARDLWRFVLGDNSKSNITSRTLKFLESHEHKNGIPPGLFRTFRETATQWVQWRHKYSNKSLDLEMIERECSISMKINGYRPLKTWSNVRNHSLPSITDLNCTFAGC